MTEVVICKEKVRLVSAYDEAAQAYGKAVRELQRIIGVSSRKDYEAQYRMAEALRHDALDAQITLERHIEVHGC